MQAAALPHNPVALPGEYIHSVQHMVECLFQCSTDLDWQCPHGRLFVVLIGAELHHQQKQQTKKLLEPSGSPPRTFVFSHTNRRRILPKRGHFLSLKHRASTCLWLAYPTPSAKMDVPRAPYSHIDYTFFFLLCMNAVTQHSRSHAHIHAHVPLGLVGARSAHAVAAIGGRR